MASKNTLTSILVLKYLLHPQDMVKNSSNISINATLFVPDYFDTDDEVLRDIVKDTKEKTRSEFFGVRRLFGNGTQLGSIFFILLTRPLFN